MTSQRIAQTNQQQKSEKPQGSGILQRVAVRSVSDAGVQSTDDQEELALNNSAFSKDFSQVPISTTTPAQMMTKLMINPVEDKNDVVQRYQKTNKGKLSEKAELLVTNDQELYASEKKLNLANQIGGQVEFEGGSKTQEVNKKVEGTEQETTTHLKQVQPKVKKDTELYSEIYGKGKNKGWDAAQDIQKLVVELEEQVYARVNNEDREEEKLDKAKDEIRLENNPNKTKEQLKAERRRKVRARVLELAKHPEVGARQALKEYLVSNMNNLSRELLPTDCRALANFILGGEGVETVLPQENQPEVGVGLKIEPKQSGKEEWPFHYAAIIMTDGQDHVTLENAAAKASKMYSKLQYDCTWYFEMYGEQTGQTFENKYQADFDQSGEVKKFTTSNQPQKSDTPQASDILQKKEISRTSSESMNTSGVIQENKTGLPDNLKAGIENLSGMSMDDVKVHYNSSKPAQIQALAYTQGKDIYVGSGQERHLAHEAWHVVQQKLGRVKPTLQAKGVAINDEDTLEKEADEMGTRVKREISEKAHKPAALQIGNNSNSFGNGGQTNIEVRSSSKTIQRMRPAAVAARQLIAAQLSQPHGAFVLGNYNNAINHVLILNNNTPYSTIDNQLRLLNQPDVSVVTLQNNHIWNLLTAQVSQNQYLHLNVSVRQFRRAIAADVLREQLSHIGVPLPQDQVQTHHIVEYGDHNAVVSRHILSLAGIDINASINAVHLPSVPRDDGGNASIHRGSHTQNYSERVRDRLINAIAPVLQFPAAANIVQMVQQRLLVIPNLQQQPLLLIAVSNELQTIRHELLTNPSNIPRWELNSNEDTDFNP